MSDTTLTPLPNGDSKIFGVSIRGWLAFGLVFSVCANQLLVTGAAAVDAVLTKDFSRIGTFSTIGEPLYSLAIGSIGFYFGQAKTKT